MRAPVLLLLTALAGAAEVYQAPSAEPTPDETLILELMNRFRANPSAEAKYIVDTFGKGDRVLGADARMFLEECAPLKPMPPLVFNLQLLDSARKHSYYMIHNGLTHVEEPEKRGFTGVSFGDRAKAAGYAGFASAENAFAGSSGALNSHVGFIVDFGAGPGGMQPGRGHRANMMGNHREAGPGGVPNGNGLSVTHNFGSRGAGRLVGGVVHVDLNDNAFYDAGEGKGGVLITASDGSHVTTWSSGAFTLELKSDGPVTLKAEYNGQQCTRQFPAGQDNLSFTWRIAQQAEFDSADRLLAAVDKETDPAGPGRFKAVVALALAAPGLLVDAPRRERIAAALGDIGGQLATAQQAVREAFDGEPAAMRRLLGEHAKTYRGTAAAAWFKEAETAFNASQSVQGFLKQAAAVKPAPSAERDLIRQLEGAREALKVGEFAGRVGALVGRVRSRRS
jgi:hypothetical protein